MMTAGAPTFDPDWASTADWANYYRSIGFNVVPSIISADGAKKHPITRWTEFQSSELPQAVHERWYGEEGENKQDKVLGFITGRGSIRNGEALLIVDIDVKGGKEGPATWLSWLDEHNNGSEVETWTAITGSGGRHLYFKYPASIDIGNSQEKWRGIDIRAQGGFIVAPPSIHYLPGKSYAWAEGCAPWETDIADAPDWLVDVVRMIVDATLATSPRVRTEDNGQTFDAFGNQIDGRERKMADMAYAAVIDAYRLSPNKPSLDDTNALAARVYETFANGVKSRLSDPSRTKDELLEAEGRGLTEMQAKVRRHIRNWSTSIATAARTPRLSDMEKKVASAARGSADDLLRVRHVADWWAEDAHPEAAHLKRLVTEAGLMKPAASPVTTDAPESDEWASVNTNGAILPPDDKTPIPVKSAFPIDRASIPPRAWVIPGLLLRKNTSVLVAPGGVGKSLLTMQLAINLALGNDWGGWHISKPSRVLIVNAEDDYDEMCRRLLAACDLMKVDQSMLIDRVFLAEDPQSIVVAKIDPKTKTVIHTPLVSRLEATIDRDQIDVVIADPFAETFEGDENSNSEIKWAASIWRSIARNRNASVLLVHHTKKYAHEMAGDADASRGAGALVNSSRITATLFGMSESEASTFDVPVEDRVRYVRFDDAKANHSLITKDAKWFRKVSVDIGNSRGLEPSDEVGVLAPWSPPGLLEGVSDKTLNIALDHIERGLLDDDGRPTGAYFTANKTTASSARWAGSVVMQAIGCDEPKAKKVLKVWQASGLLVEFEYNDGKQVRKGLRVDDDKRPGEVR